MDRQISSFSMRFHDEERQGRGDSTAITAFTPASSTRQRTEEEEEERGNRLSSSSSLRQRQYPPQDESRMREEEERRRGRRMTGEGRGKAKAKEEEEDQDRVYPQPRESTLHRRRQAHRAEAGGGGEEEEESRRRRRTTEGRRRTTGAERIRDDDEVDALYTSIDYVGQTIETSKIRYTWLLSIRGHQCQIDFLHSKVSGKKRLALNGHLIYEQQVMRPHKFLYSWPVSEHLLSIVYESTDGHFHLTIDGLPFNYFTRRNKLLRNPQLGTQEQRAHSTAFSLHPSTTSPSSLSSQNLSSSSSLHQQEPAHHRLSASSSSLSLSYPSHVSAASLPSQDHRLSHVTPPRSSSAVAQGGVYTPELARPPQKEGRRADSHVTFASSQSPHPELRTARRQESLKASTSSSSLSHRHQQHDEEEETRRRRKEEEEERELAQTGGISLGGLRSGVSGDSGGEERRNEEKNNQANEERRRRRHNQQEDGNTKKDKEEEEEKEKEESHATTEDMDLLDLFGSSAPPPAAALSLPSSSSPPLSSSSSSSSSLLTELPLDFSSSSSCLYPSPCTGESFTAASLLPAGISQEDQTRAVYVHQGDIHHSPQTGGEKKKDDLLLPFSLSGDKREKARKEESRDLPSERSTNLHVLSSSASPTKKISDEVDLSSSSSSVHDRERDGDVCMIKTTGVALRDYRGFSTDFSSPGQKTQDRYIDTLHSTSPNQVSLHFPSSSSSWNEERDMMAIGLPCMAASMQRVDEGLLPSPANRLSPHASNLFHVKLDQHPQSQHAPRTMHKESSLSSSSSSSPFSSSSSPFSSSSPLPLLLELQPGEEKKRESSVVCSSSSLHQDEKDTGVRKISYAEAPPFSSSSSFSSRNPFERVPPDEERERRERRNFSSLPSCREEHTGGTDSGRSLTSMLTPEHRLEYRHDEEQQEEEQRKRRTEETASSDRNTPPAQSIQRKPKEEEEDQDQDLSSRAHISHDGAHQPSLLYPSSSSSPPSSSSASSSSSSFQLDRGGARQGRGRSAMEEKEEKEEGRGFDRSYHSTSQANEKKKNEREAGGVSASQQRDLHLLPREELHAHERRREREEESEEARRKGREGEKEEKGEQAKDKKEEEKNADPFADLMKIANLKLHITPLSSTHT